MNTDFPNPLQVPRPKVRSHLTIRVQSKLMSRPSPPPPVRGPKPPVAPKPGPPCEPRAQGESSPPPSLSNGDLAHSDEDPREMENLDEEESGEDGVDGAGEETEKEADGVGSEDTVKAEDGSNVDSTQGENTDNDLTPPEGGAHTDDETSTSTPSLHPAEMEDETGEEAEEEEEEKEEEEPSFSERTDSSGHVEQHLDQPPLSQGSKDNEEVDRDPDETDLEVGGFAFGFSVLPTVTEEYPYDVIGPTDDASDTCEPAETGETEVWQPERATKDLSGCFRFTSSTEDVFGPYSVIEAVPPDMTVTADPEWSQDDADADADADDRPSDEPRAAGASDPEPYYVSSDDVDKLEDKRVLSELGGIEESAEPPAEEREGVAKDGESTDEYADIDDSLCLQAEERRAECVSSEDYVEIGDDDEEEETEKKPVRGKTAKERTAKREQAFLGSQRASCQPRLRLCNITVPTEPDAGRTPEMTNRVVFAHTTEAFEEDIEELDCHIVPYDEDSDSEDEEHIYEEAGFDSEGENFVTIDRKSVVTRSRSYSGKFSGFVPETVPEETGTEYQTHDYCTVALDENDEPLSRSQPPGGKSLIPSMKSQRFLFYSRSAEGPELTLTSPTDINHSRKDDLRMKRKDDTLSLPCVITSSGSFSQRSLQSSSGVSTPTSLVDIPPPFQLAYIAKRPVAKSSPSLLIHHEPSETPKKKSSFKRFLALKFKRKTDAKGFGEVSVRSSRSSSESSHHGAARVIELDRRSTGSSPQLQNRVANPQQRPLEPPPPFVLYKDLQRKKGDPKTFVRGVSRVESFEERSRRSAMPLPLTKPRSISFPSADTSDYENIPAMSSDYENIQIPSRPTRSHTVTEFFEDPNRATVACNENDGYVDMNSFPGFESITQTSKEDPER
ncbi:FYVE, RhoGEF and PH domain-containing protein 5 [Liparis tanakae]|uniref:FYVE, RhoGEF and PH domain-containing protein 5 n=1 Tax=Liparis tanakae TaxID=230148 RepID=A0A4Z2FMB2_9TELE|nr:FYVE, RhoGEF and PH domain-containing protein 5 [Liparis tanakae]